MKIKIGLGLFFLILIGFSIFYAIYFFPIRKIACSTQYSECGNEIMDFLSTLEGKNSRAIKKEINSYLGSKNYKSYQIKRDFLDRIQINIEVKKGYVQIVSGAGMYIVDNQGEVIDNVKESFLPKIIIEEDVAEIGFVADIINWCQKEFGVNEGILKKDSFVVVINDIEVIFPVEGDIDSLGATLKLILSQLNSLGSETRIREIDLRFKNAVVR